MPTSNSSSKPLRVIGLTRKSRGEDEGTHADQRRRIERVCDRDGFTLLRVEKEHQVSGAKQWREREIGQAIADVEAGRADGIVVATEDRITRERLEAAIEIWTEFERVGVVFVTDDGVDSRRGDDAEFSFHLNAILARKQWKAYQKRSNMGRGRAVAMGVHGGDDPPFGYQWTERADGSKNLSGNAKHGPLDADPEKAPIAAQVFERRAAGAARKELIRLTGLSEGAVLDMLRNRVYTGVAYSGDYINNNGIGEGLLEGTPCKPTHQALVTPELFERVQRTFQRKRPSTVRGRDSSLLSRVLACGTCGRSLVLDRSLKSYRCKDERCPKPVTITDHRIEPYVFHHALTWHAVLSPMYKVETDAALPEVTKALAEALNERDDIEQAEGLTALRRAQALTEVDGKIAQLEQVLAEVEAANGWLGMDSDAVMRRLVADGPIEVTKEGHPAPRCSDLRAGNEFIREMLRVVVKPVGRGRKVPVADRVEVNCLTPASAAVPVEEHEVAVAAEEA